MRCDLSVLGGHALLPGASSADAWAALDRPALRGLPAGRALAPFAAPHDVGGWLDPWPTDPDFDAADDPLAHLVAASARQALASSDLPRSRTGLVVATLSLPSTWRARHTGASWTRRLGLLHPAFRAEGPDAQPGSTTERVALTLGLGGPTLTLDAACASGLYAVALAAHWLSTGRCDAVVVVGACAADPWYLQSGFHALKALSTTGRSRPFAQGADGLCVAEGAASVLLARPGPPAWARLAAVGVGTGAPKGNPLAPDPDAQRALLRRTWEGLEPATCGLVEAHATGTAAGDRAELVALSDVLPGVALHSFKAWTGHPLTAAGVAGLLRAALAVRDGCLPAMPCAEPLPETSTFRLLSANAAWDGPRWAGVSAFGMGGTLAHAVLCDGEPPRAAAALRPRVAARTAALRPPSTEVGWTSGRWRVPPTEVARWLPAQALVLDALGDVAPADGTDRVAVVVRADADDAPGVHVLDAALRAAGVPVNGLAPPLDADRVLGSLGNLLANRASNQLGLRGPSALVLGGDPFELVSAWLAAGDNDEVLVAVVSQHPEERLGALALRIGPASDGCDPAMGAPTVQGDTVAFDGRIPPMSPAAFRAPIHLWRAQPRGPAWSGPWDGSTVPTPLPGNPPNFVALHGVVAEDQTALDWPLRPSPTTPTRDPGDPLDAFVRHRHAVADAHARFLALRGAAADALAVFGTPSTRPVVPPSLTLDRRALEAHASGSLGDAFGPDWADLDGVRPRVRMPAPPLLLCHRAYAFEGTPRALGPAAVTTEYDIPDDPSWHDGRPPACVVVESGQADLLLVSWLGVDALTQGRAVYRLLDCDLHFHAERPAPGRTIRHAIRIHRFTRLGGTILFWFAYDATVDGTPVLTMRNGCAGFFPPSELARPQGVSAAPEPYAGPPVVPRRATLPDALDAAALDALANGPGPRLARPPWRLGHRVTHLAHSGGAHGLGHVVVEQDLADSDWFNPVHFVDDPCMPGTLMFEGCVQAVHIWLLTAGAGDAFEEARFEPLVDRPVRLRCRGQVAPGHRRLRYEAFVRQADLHGPEPWAVADLVLSVDGVTVVRAHDVGARIVGQRRPDARAARGLLEFAVGSASAAMGSHYRPYDVPERCARMAGPPIALIGEVLTVDGPPGVIGAPAAVVSRTPLRPTDALLRADPGPVPFGVLLETLLQPCGWLTAWQGAGLVPGRVLAFRNLDGVAILHRVPFPGDVGVRATQESTALSGGVRIHVFRTVLSDEAGPVIEATTRFGYFGPDALARQAGLPDEPAPELGQDAIHEDLADHPALPRRDGRFVHRLVCRRSDLWVAEADVQADAWFFEAHFLQDPVMPGSLGLDGLVQLARLAWWERTGRRGTLLPGALRWTYRGQVTQTARTLRFELHLGDGPAWGVVRVDGVAIYRLDGIAIGDPPPAPPSVERTHLLDAFDAATGLGHLRLDPADQPWLHDHRPTRAQAAVPLAMSIAVAVEAAARLRPARPPTHVPWAEALRWLAVGDEAERLDVTARPTGDDVTVELAIRGVVGARVRVAFEPTAPPAAVDPGPVEPVDVDAFRDGGHSFHGPSLSRLDALAFGPDGGAATIAAGALPGALDAHTLDGATWPMASANPERWGCLAGLAYPVRVENLVWRARRDVPMRATVRRVEATGRRLAFDVALAADGDVVASCRWIETVVPPGPLLGLPGPVRRAFLWDRRPSDVHLGRADGDAWQVSVADLVEPMPGTVAAHWRHPDDEDLPLADLVAAKELVRTRIDAHPAAIRLVRLSDGLAVVAVDDVEVDDFLAAVGPRAGRVIVARGRAAWQGRTGAPR